MPARLTEKIKTLQTNLHVLRNKTRLEAGKGVIAFTVPGYFRIAS